MSLEVGLKVFSLSNATKNPNCEQIALVPCRVVHKYYSISLHVMKCLGVEITLNASSFLSTLSYTGLVFLTVLLGDVVTQLSCWLVALVF